MDWPTPQLCGMMSSQTGTHVLDCKPANKTNGQVCFFEEVNWVSFVPAYTVKPEQFERD